MISASPSVDPRALPLALARFLVVLLAALGLVLTAVAVAPTAAAATGAISGAVNGPDGPLAGVQVTAYVPHPDYAGEWNIVGTTSTDATGAYTLSGLAARSYQIEFVDPGRSYVTEYYDDVTSLNAAAAVPVGTTTVTGIDATLGLPSHIAGTVRDTAGTGIPSVLVTALRFDPVDGWVTDQTTLTDDLGAYDVPGLSHGVHRVEFRPYGAQSGRYRLEYWDDAASKDEATDVTVAPASTVNGIDAVLASVTGAGRILGTVTGMAGDAVSDVTVTVYSHDATTDRWVARTRALTDATGAYSLGGLAPGTYRVGFAHDDHVAEFWQDAASLSGATDVVVGSSATVPGVDADLTSLPITNTSAPTVTGDAVVGGTLTATSGAWRPGTGFSYQYEWLADDEPIAGATGSQYQPGSADLGKAISVRVTASRGSETPASATSVATGPVTELTVANQTAPEITGTAQVHSTLTATDGTWTPSTGLTFAYQWFVGGVPVDGATLSTYTLRPADADQAVTVRVTASKPTYTPASATSAPTGAVALAPLTNTVAPSISGPAQVGATLTAARGTWSPDDGLTVGYQWYVGGAPVDGATGTTYHPVDGDVGQSVTVLVSVSRAGHQPASRLSAPTSAVTIPALANTAMPTVTGTPQVGGTLTATTGEWSPSDGVVQQVEWLVGGVPVDHEGSTYSPTADDVGKAVAVRVTATRAGFSPGHPDVDPHRRRLRDDREHRGPAGHRHPAGRTTAHRRARHLVALRAHLRLPVARERQARERPDREHLHRAPERAAPHGGRARDRLRLRPRRHRHLGADGGCQGRRAPPGAEAGCHRRRPGRQGAARDGGLGEPGRHQGDLPVAAQRPGDPARHQGHLQARHRRSPQADLGGGHLRAGGLHDAPGDLEADRRGAVAASQRPSSVRVRATTSAIAASAPVLAGVMSMNPCTRPS